MPTDTNTPDIRALPLDSISPTDLNPRRRVTDEDVTELADSIKAVGLAQPIAVWPAENALFHKAAIEGATYLIVAGERRWKAAHLAGMTEIPAIIRHDLTDKAALEITVTENLQRRDLNPIEEARGYNSMKTLLKLTNKQIAKRLGKSPDTITEALQLLELPNEVQTWLAEGTLSKAHARALRVLVHFPLFCVNVAAQVIATGTQPAALHSRIAEFIAYSGAEEGWRRIDWRTTFDTTICKTACPHGAFFKDRTYGGNDGVCLHPGHFHELTQNAQALRNEEAAAALAKVKAETGSDAQELKDLITPGNWEHLSHSQRPAGCTDQCPCYRAGTLNGKPATICLDAKRYRGLKIKQARADMKAARAQAAEAHRQIHSRATSTLDVFLDDTNRRALILMAQEAMNQLNKRAGVRDALKTLGDEATARTIDDWPTSIWSGEALTLLNQLTDAEILRLVAIAITFEHVNHEKEEKRTSWKATFYLDGTMPKTPAWMTKPRCSVCDSRPCCCPPKKKDHPTAAPAAAGEQDDDIDADDDFDTDPIIHNVLAELDRRGITDPFAYDIGGIDLGDVDEAVMALDNSYPVAELDTPILAAILKSYGPEPPQDRDA